MGWTSTRHRCDLPFQVHNRVELGDIWACDECHREWEVYSRVGPTEGGYYARYDLGFTLLTDDSTRPVMRRIN